MTKIAEWLFWPSWLHWPHLPTWDTVAYKLGIGSLTTWGIMQHVAPVVMWLALAGAAVCAAAWWLTARFPNWLAWIPGISTVVNVGRTARVLAIALAALALACFVAWFVTLLWSAEQYRSLNGKVLDLTSELGCFAREKESEHDLFVCVVAMRADAEQAAKEKLDAQIRLDADEKNRLTAERDAARADLAASEAEIDADEGATDQLAPAISRYFDRLRARRGLK